MRTLVVFAVAFSICACSQERAPVPETRYEGPTDQQVAEITAWVRETHPPPPRHFLEESNGLYAYAVPPDPEEASQSTRMPAPMLAQFHGVNRDGVYIFTVQRPNAMAWMMCAYPCDQVKLETPTMSGNSIRYAPVVPGRPFANIIEDAHSGHLDVTPFGSHPAWEGSRAIASQWKADQN